MVSIVIPVYNTKKYVETCIESVLRQTYKRLEIILVDDGSTDGSGEICDEYQKKDSRILVIHQENQGLASARNRGIEKTSGKYIYFVDSDDCVHQRLIEITVGIAEERNANIVQVDFKNVPENFEEYQQGIIDDYVVFEFSLEQALKNLEVDCKQYAQDIRLSTTVAWSKLYKREIFKNTMFVDGVRIHEDQLSAHRFIIHGGGVVFCNAKLYFYRTAQNSLIRSGWKSDKLFIIDCYKDRLESVFELNQNGEYAKLVTLIYKKYLICILRNYVMVNRHIEKAEKKNIEKELMIRMKRELQEKRYGRLPYKHKVALHCFVTVPHLFVWIYCKTGRV